jgi:hypothetical protein
MDDDDDDETNEFFDVAHTNEIVKGACTHARGGPQGSQLAQTHTLLLIWPNDPDPVDNPQSCVDNDHHKESSSSQPIWFVDCLLACCTAGGSRVVCAGDRQDQIQQLVGGGTSSSSASDMMAAPDCGIFSTQQIQNLLKEHFSLVDTVDLPNWWLNVDDMTIWEWK